MNSLDQAFLKAYAKQTDGGVHPPEPPVTGEPSHDAAESRSTGTYQRRDSGHSTAPRSASRPHAAFPAPAGLPQEAPQPAAPLTLSSVFAPPQQSEESREFLADWEVDRFTWPDLCGRLIDLERRYFQRVGEQLRAATSQSHHVVLVSGARRGEGRTTLALCLAHSVSSAGVDVAVVDADWQKPQIGNRLGVETPCSWTDVLTGKRSLSEVAVTSIEEHVTLFPLKPSSHWPVSTPDGGPSGILRRISDHFPLVIIDAGPLDGQTPPPFVCGKDVVAVMITWSPQTPPPFVCGKDGPIDAAIVVRDLRHTSEQEVLASVRRLQHSGIAAVGIAENFASEST